MGVDAEIDKKEKLKEYFVEYRIKNRKKIRENSLRWYYNNRERCLENGRKYRFNNLEKNRKRCRDYNKNHKEERKIYKKKWEIKNRDKINASARKYKKLNHKKVIACTKKWRNEHKKEIANYANKYMKKRRKQYPSIKILGNLRSKIRIALKRNNIEKKEQTIDLIGCSPYKLKIYLESKFKKGMTWNNYGKNGWHIDHIIPCAVFDLTKEIQRRKCFHYTNLQPLWAQENWQKGKIFLSPIGECYGS